MTMTSTFPTIYEVTTADGVCISTHSRIDRATDTVDALARDGRRARLHRHDFSASGERTRTTAIDYRPSVPQ